MFYNNHAGYDSKNNRGNNSENDMEDAEKSPPATKYVDKNTKTFYYLKSDQITITPVKFSEKIGNVVLEPLLHIIKLARDKMIDNAENITDWKMTNINSGYWYPDTKSIYYNEKIDFIEINSFDNVMFEGKLDGRKVNILNVLYYDPKFRFFISDDLQVYYLSEKKE